MIIKIPFTKIQLTVRKQRNYSYKEAYHIIAKYLQASENDKVNTLDIHSDTGVPIELCVKVDDPLPAVKTAGFG